MEKHLDAGNSICQGVRGGKSGEQCQVCGQGTPRFKPSPFCTRAVVSLPGPVHFEMLSM